MRLVVLTSIRKGPASRVIPALFDNPNIEIAKVILANGQSPNRTRNLKRKIIKTLKIGVLGALNGLRLRSWYVDEEADDIEYVCGSRNIEVFETEYINCGFTEKLFREANADLGLSLGNGYIANKIFSIPRHGMINIHTEILPEYQGAQSIIWPIYEGCRKTGFTIHQIDNSIDTGDILYQKKRNIFFFETLKETVQKNMELTWRDVPAAFSYVCQNYPTLKLIAVQQKKSKSYTTPSFWQFLRMISNNRKAYQETN